MKQQLLVLALTFLGSGVTARIEHAFQPSSSSRAMLQKKHNRHNTINLLRENATPSSLRRLRRAQVKSSSGEYTNPKSCEKYEGDPPETGEKCPKKVMTCFFGSQRCGGANFGGEQLPTTTCHSNGKHGTKEWTCEDIVCPTSAPVSPPEEPEAVIAATEEAPPQVCPPAGFQVFNDAACPATFRDGVEAGMCSEDQDGLSCDFGTETWCVC